MASRIKSARLKIPTITINSIIPTPFPNLAYSPEIDVFLPV
jgi:hypothetical protein